MVLVQIPCSLIENHYGSTSVPGLGTGADPPCKPFLGNFSIAGLAGSRSVKEALQADGHELPRSFKGFLRIWMHWVSKKGSRYSVANGYIKLIVYSMHELLPLVH